MYYTSKAVTTDMARPAIVVLYNLIMSSFGVSNKLRSDRDMNDTARSWLATLQYTIYVAAWVFKAAVVVELQDS